MKRDSIKLKFVRPEDLIAEASRLCDDSRALNGYKQIRQWEGGDVGQLGRHYSDLIALAMTMRSAEPGYTDNFDGVSKIRRLTWRERLTGRVRP